MPNEVRTDLERARTLPAWIYTDPAVFQHERRHFFPGAWHYVGSEADVAQPGDYIALTVADEPVLLVRGTDGELRAFHNVCRHRGSVICKGSGHRKVLQCPYHAWTYGLDGRLLKARELDGLTEADRAELGLVPLRLERLGPFLFVQPDPSGPAFAEIAGPLPADLAGHDLSTLRKRRTLRYSIAANWKVVVDNFLECYHCAVAHPSFADLIDLSRYTFTTYQRCSLQVGPIQDAQGEAESRFYWLWPTFMLNLYPGPIVSINVILPDGPERTTAWFELYFPEDTPAATEEEWVAFIDQVQREDTALCEDVQVGLHSRAYTRGRYAPSEICVHHFHQLLAEAYRATGLPGADRLDVDR
jgi:phenylpropionate dioxygenase-like ring-hydroxylating dioxygenase large terminal subunit